MKNKLSILFVLSFAAMVFFFACNNLSENKKLEIAARQFAIEKANKNTESQHQIIFEEFDSRLKDPKYAPQAKKYENYMATLHLNSLSINKYLDSLLNLVENNTEKAAILHDEKYVSTYLYDKVQNLKVRTFAFDTSLSRYLKDEVIFTLKDSVVKPNQFFKIFFKDKSLEEIAFNLVLLKNSVAVFESNIATYYLDNSYSNYDGYNSFSAIVAQSASIVQPGEELTITAGVGAFSTTADPHISINGQDVKVGVEGLATGTIKASTKPGVYFVPVKVNFTSYYGTKEYKEYKIQYTVFEPQ